jgi:hypothetical protein
MQALPVLPGIADDMQHKFTLLCSCCFALSCSLRGNPWMDGTKFISQCPIPAKSSFTYRFQASSSQASSTRLSLGDVQLSNVLQQAVGNAM